MTDLVLVAASGLARETLAVLRLTGTHHVVGVLDDDPRRQGQDLDGVTVLGPIDHAARYPEAELLLCAGHGDTRRRMVRWLESSGSAHRWATVVHPGAALADDTVLGPGSIVLAGVVATADVVVGEHVVLMPGVVLTHGDRVADFATLCAGTVLGGDVHVGEGAYLGMGSRVRERTSIGAGATLGMGACLLRDLPTGQTWVGTPARPLPADVSEVS